MHFFGTCSLKERRHKEVSIFFSLVTSKSRRCVDYAFRVDGIIRGLDFNPLELRLAATGPILKKVSFSCSTRAVQWQNLVLLVRVDDQ